MGKYVVVNLALWQKFCLDTAQRTIVYMTTFPSYWNQVDQPWEGSFAMPPPRFPNAPLNWFGSSPNFYYNNERHLQIRLMTIDIP